MLEKALQNCNEHSPFISCLLLCRLLTLHRSCSTVHCRGCRGSSGVDASAIVRMPWWSKHLPLWTSKINSNDMRGAMQDGQAWSGQPYIKMMVSWLTEFDRFHLGCRVSNAWCWLRAIISSVCKHNHWLWAHPGQGSNRGASFVCRCREVLQL